MSDVFPAEPVPKTTTRNSRRSRPARRLESSSLSRARAVWSPICSITRSACSVCTPAASIKSAGAWAGRVTVKRERQSNRATATAPTAKSTNSAMRNATPNARECCAKRS